MVVNGAGGWLVRDCNLNNFYTCSASCGFDGDDDDDGGLSPGVTGFLVILAICVLCGAAGGAQTITFTDEWGDTWVATRQD